MHDPRPVVITETIDAATVAEAHRTFLELLAEDTDVEIAAETTAAYIEHMLEGYALERAS